MKNLTMSFWKRLGLAAVILVAGFCYSCGLQGAPVPLMADGGTVLAEAAEPGKAGNAAEAAAEPENVGRMADAVADSTAKVCVPEVESTAKVTVTEASTTSTSICYVHVCGEVTTPGVYELEEGQRICDAIARAGGFTEIAAKDYLNLAEPVWDGMKLMVPKQSDIPKQEWAPESVGYGMTGVSGATGVSGGNGLTAGKNSDSQLINLNTATKEELMTLPGIGEARAGDIIRYREEHGGFEKIEDVMKISGIKEAAFQKIKDKICLRTE